MAKIPTEVDTGQGERIYITVGNASERPSAGIKNHIFVETDTGKVMADDGSSWTEVGQQITQQTGLTAKDTGTVDGTYGTAEANVIQNNRTRIEEIETRLSNVGILP